MIRVMHGDCREILAGMPADSVDACVTDPPYGLEFMGKEWDKLAPTTGSEAFRPREGSTSPIKSKFKNGVGTRMGQPQKNKRCRTCGRLNFDHEKYRCKCDTPDWDTRQSEYARDLQGWHEAWAREVYRVLRPGGHMLAFSGTRTSHRMVCAIEDAGFEIRDTLMWIYGSGFPKSHNVSVAIDKMHGIEPRSKAFNMKGRGDRADELDANGRTFLPEYEAATPEAARWAGWHTALKPSHEPIVLARKPLDGTVAACVLKHGTGAINVDACRVAHGADVDLTHVQRQQHSDGAIAGAFGAASLIGKEIPTYNASGRWPANILHDGSPEVMDAFGVFGESASPPPRERSESRERQSGFHMTAGSGGYADTGTAARFFYTAKANAADRADSRHPTIKPISLMQWLVRLITPQNGTILDPFAGSGTTGEAAMLERFNAILIEQDATHVADIQHRIDRWSGADLSLFKSAAE